MVILASVNTLTHSASGQVVGGHHTGLLEELGGQMNEQCTARLAVGQIAEFVELGGTPQNY